jgi:hypothetical protein
MKNILCMPSVYPLCTTTVIYEVLVLNTYMHCTLSPDCLSFLSTSQCENQEDETNM